ncbi:MAG TPA: RluA family pseudouridine synthase [Fulvivirga sp.]|nr:RluA family pseudouridine synthase [Fulvivirga sp.]
MTAKRTEFRIPPKKFQPKGCKIIYEDQDILVVDKMCGLLTVGNAAEKEKTAHFILNEYVKKGNHRSKNRVYVVHRIDRDTSGVLVFAKTERVKQFLQQEWANFSKKYNVIVHGTLKEKEGIITSQLLENKAFKVYSVKDPTKGKLAKTGYKVIKESKGFSLLEIDLFTGRKHQIRVHLSELGHPVVGDKVYGEKSKGRLALNAASLTIIHPHTKEKMTFETVFPDDFRKLLGGK